MSINQQHSFWGSLSPLGGLTGAGLLIMASARLSWAITIAGSLFWVYGLTALTFAFLVSSGKKFLPVGGHTVLYVCLASFWGSLYLLIFWLLCPLAALEVFLLLLLVPLFCASSGVAEQIASSMENTQHEIMDSVLEVIYQAAVLAGLIVAFSIVREPLSYCSLSVPGSYQGMVMIISFKPGSFFPIEIFSSSAGALLLLGYIVCLYQYSKSNFKRGER